MSEVFWELCQRPDLGDNAFDPARRGPAAESGRAQGRQIAAEVARVWGAR